MTGNNILKLSMAYPDAGMGDAEILLSMVRRLYPDSRVKKTDIRDGYYHIYVNIRRPEESC